MKQMKQTSSLPSDTALSVNGISKKFCRHLKRSMAYGIMELSQNLVGLKPDTTKLRKAEFWALEDVSFELKRGEFFGIIGSNGSGKSTLLRVIAGIFPPDKGEVAIRGRVGALIALGAGFHPHMTGKENIYLNGSILGMNRRFINSRFDRIVQFAEIGEFLDAPVSTYSSGMRVRLGFSIAVNMAPDVLLVDEVLSVGDSSFRQRCYNYMTEYKENGGTVIFISHNTLAVEQVCDRVMWLEHGCVQQIGEASAVVGAYEQLMLEMSREAETRLDKGEKVRAEDPLRFTKTEVRDSRGQVTEKVAFGQSFQIRLHFKADTDIEGPMFGIGLRKGFNAAHPLICAMTMQWDGTTIGRLPREGCVNCDIHEHQLSPGTYTIQGFVHRHVSGKMGEKYWVRPITIGSFIVTPGTLREKLPTIASAHLVNNVPAMVMNYEWKL